MKIRRRKIKASFQLNKNKIFILQYSTFIHRRNANYPPTYPQLSSPTTTQTDFNAKWTSSLDVLKDAKDRFVIACGILRFLEDKESVLYHIYFKRCGKSIHIWISIIHMQDFQILETSSFSVFQNKAYPWAFHFYLILVKYLKYRWLNNKFQRSNFHQLTISISWQSHANQ